MTQAMGPTDPARLEERHYGDLKVNPITNNGDTSVVTRDNNFMEPLGFVGYVDMPEGKFFAFPNGSEQMLGSDDGFDSEKEAVEALRQRAQMVDELEHYLDRRATLDDVAQAEEWRSNNPNGDLAEYVDAMKAIGAL